MADETRHADAAWEPMPTGDEDRIWERLEVWGGRGGLVPACPHVVLRVPAALDLYDPTHAERIGAFNLGMLAAFRSVVERGERVAALDWNHACWWLDVHVPMEHGATAASLSGFFGGPMLTPDQLRNPPPLLWRVPYLPDGDHTFHVTADLRLGVAAHPWNNTLTVFGVPLLAALGRNTTPLLHQMGWQAPSP